MNSPLAAAMEEEAPSSSSPEQSLPASSEGREATPSAGSSTIIGAPGGPLYRRGFVSPLINVREFHGSHVTLLMALHAALDDASVWADDVDLLVADLKIVSDEELVNSALEKMLQEENVLDELGNGTSVTTPTLKRCELQEAMSPCVAEDSLRSTQDVLSQQSCCNQTQKMRDGILSSSAKVLDKDLKGEQPGKTNPYTDGEGASITENDSEGNYMLQQKSQTNRYKKRGRPFDRVQRAANLEMNETSFKESHYERLRMERENARANTRLQSLSVKLEQERVSAPSENMKRMQGLVPSKINTMAVDTFEQVLPFEVVFWIDVYHPYDPDQRRKRKSQEFLVLGSQLLTAFREKICCRTDALMQRAHAYVPSGYLFIENVFYNDLQDARAIDYSIPFLDWVKEQEVKAIGSDLEAKETIGKRSKFPVFQRADMASTRFWDLECRVGMRYLYCHQGDCKHDIVIRDIRLVHKEDVQNTKLYPLLRAQSCVRHRMCSICRIYRARKVTYDDKWAPESPCFFCDYCYYLLHYSQEGTLLYSNFKVYDYRPE